ncbi:RNA polymerase sigma factor [Sorangium cellulosum]|uniref:RNA polymerase sigma factor n=1 Tax=Sorangium cellulosum TaxID=56 RepID=UPI00133155AA|nr:sigma-70 family RNA polymerase sigma factor [Sorangium cellulosum]
MEPSHAFMAAVADEHFAFIARYLARLGVRAQDVEDVAQEVLAGAYRALPRFDPSRGSVRSWLMGIATHQASNHFRRAHRRRERLRPFDELAALPDGTPDSEQRAIARDRRGVLDKLLEEMPFERRAVFVAHEIEELDMAEIAEQLSIPLSTAWSRHRLAWIDIEASVRRWQARQRGRGLAMLPFSAGALVHEARADREVAGALLARFCRRALDALSPRRLALAGGAGARAALYAAAAAVGAGLVAALALSAPPAAPSPALAMAAAAPSPAAPPPSPAPAAPRLPGAAAAAGVPGDDRAAGATSAFTSRARSAALPGSRPAARPAGDAASRPSPAAAAPRRPRPAEDREIAAERALIDGAIEALSSGRHAEARRRLADHARRFPAGRLTAERDAALRALRGRHAR